MNRLIKRTFFLLLILGMTAQLQARGNNLIDVNINNEDLEVEYTNINAWSRNSQTLFSAGMLNAYDKDDIRHMLYTVTLMQEGLTDLRGVSFGIGFRGVFSMLDEKVDPYGKNDSHEVGALGVRAKFMYTFPLRVKTILGLTANYGPRSLSINTEMEQYREYRLELSAEPIDGGWIYAGYRGIEFKFDNDEVYEMNQKLYVGMKIYF